MSLYDEAIVEAKRIREAAQKAAEAELIEKHAKKIKQVAEQKINEQQPDPFADDEEDPLADPMGPADDALGFDTLDDGEPSDSFPEAHPAAMDGEPACPCAEEDEEIEIDFSQLQQAVRAENESEYEDHEEVADEIFADDEEEENPDFTGAMPGEEERLEESVDLSEVSIDEIYDTLAEMELASPDAGVDNDQVARIGESDMDEAAFNAEKQYSDDYRKLRKFIARNPNATPETLARGMGIVDMDVARLVLDLAKSQNGAMNEYFTYNDNDVDTASKESPYPKAGYDLESTVFEAIRALKSGNKTKALKLLYKAQQVMQNLAMNEGSGVSCPDCGTSVPAGKGQASVACPNCGKDLEAGVEKDQVDESMTAEYEVVPSGKSGMHGRTEGEQAAETMKAVIANQDDDVADAKDVAEKVVEDLTEAVIKEYGAPRDRESLQTHIDKMAYAGKQYFEGMNMDKLQNIMNKVYALGSYAEKNRIATSGEVLTMWRKASTGPMSSKGTKALQESKNLLAEQNEKMRTLLVEAGEKLSASNTQNALLLYENRVLSNGSLNERQKKKFAGAIAGAKTVDEAKRIHDALVEAAIGKNAGDRLVDADMTLNEALSRNSGKHVQMKGRPIKDENKLSDDRNVSRLTQLAGLSGQEKL